jgi:hypothetical protein
VVIVQQGDYRVFKESFQVNLIGLLIEGLSLNLHPVFVVVNFVFVEFGLWANQFKEHGFVNVVEFWWHIADFLGKELLD